MQKPKSYEYLRIWGINFCIVVMQVGAAGGKVGRGELERKLAYVI